MNMIATHKVVRTLDAAVLHEGTELDCHNYMLRTGNDRFVQVEPVDEWERFVIDEVDLETLCRISDALLDGTADPASLKRFAQWLDEIIDAADPLSDE